MRRGATLDKSSTGREGPGGAGSGMVASAGALAWGLESLLPSVLQRAPRASGLCMGHPSSLLCTLEARVITATRKDLFEPPVDTKSDLARSGGLWATPHEAWIFSIRHATDPELKTIIRNFRVYSFEEMHRKSTTGELAFGVERLPGGHLSIMSYLQEDSISTLRLMKGDLYTDHVGLAMRKGSPYMGKMNQLIHRLLVSGILLRWEEEVVRKYMSHRIQVAALNSAVVVNDGPTKLRIEHIESQNNTHFFGRLSRLQCVFSLPLSHVGIARVISCDYA
uniref:Uncharacterized protein n=1 Tax=Timema genevievae TaxID=629358 RepID=A0A7R9K713_TIMGE|nr:unnamed protein product [Timema genevievae]